MNQQVKIFLGNHKFMLPNERSQTKKPYTMASGKGQTIETEGEITYFSLKILLFDIYLLGLLSRYMTAVHVKSGEL